MFFKMLKNDLKIKKGLNVILFIFIAAASVLVFISASQLYMQITGKKRTAEKCRLSDIILMFDNSTEKREQKLDTIRTRIEQRDGFTEYYQSEVLTVGVGQIDFNDFDENDTESFFEKVQIISALPRNCDLVYDLDDKPFYVQNGTVRISNRMRDITGAKQGDRLQIITPMARVYEFEIAGFYKEPTSNYIFRYLLSDDDYARISDDFPVKTDVFSIFAVDDTSDSVELFISDLRNNDGIPISDGYWMNKGVNDDYVTAYIVTFALILISIFMLVIILMTIRFTMLAALRDEEKEIGVMNAMGIDSISFRWLFAAKYIAFAAVGSIIGIACGLPVSKTLMKLFAGGMTFPNTYELLLVGTASSLLMTGAIILFSMIVMRRIRKISVIDAIHGENNGERFHNSSVLFLHKQRKMPVPVFLGLSDILTRFKRYIVLIIAYTLSALLILITAYLYNSVVSLDFFRYSMINGYDFFPDFSDEMMKEYDSRETAENKFFWEVFNEDLDDHGINAHVNTYAYSNGELHTGGITDCTVQFDYEDTTAIECSEGRRPVLENEVVLSSYTARRRGIKVGDEIDVGLNEYSEDKLVITLNKKKVIVTGLVDTIEWGEPVLIMGEEYDKSCINGRGFTGAFIYSDDKQAEFDKMSDLFGRDHMMNSDEAMKREFATYELPLRLLRDVITGTVIFVNILLTVLYMNIFISEDRPEIALQRCIGFRGRSIRAAQLFRMMTLTVAAAVIAIILAGTAGTVIVGKLFSVIGLSGFRFLPMPLYTWVIMPVISLLTSLIPSLIKLRKIETIDISSISNE